MATKKNTRLGINIIKVVCHVNYNMRPSPNGVVLRESVENNMSHKS